MPGNDVITNDPILMVGGISRSGTTLLTTVFDAHPDISMGAELVPAPMKGSAELLRLLDKALDLVDGDYARAGRALNKAGDKQEGLFFSRCDRAGITEAELREGLESLVDRTAGGIKDWRDRLLVAWTVMRLRWQREKTAMFGFKLNSPSILATHRLFPNARFVCLVRDPVDVVRSQTKRKFDRDLGQMMRGWTKYARTYADYAEKNPEVCTVLRYEDLVRAPRRSLMRAFQHLPVDMDESIFSYYKSDGAIFQAGHPNIDRIKMNFSDSSIGSGHKTLEPEMIAEIHKMAGRTGREFGYDNRGLVIREDNPGIFSFFHRKDLRKLNSINPITKERHRGRVTRAAKFTPEDYEKILEPYMDSHRLMRLSDYVRLDDLGDDKVVIIRHDIDHDIDTAQKMGAWEEAHGFRSTYCVLHTAWYYGGLDEDGRYWHSRTLIKGIEKLLEQGHEINFHNNLVGIALHEGTDPFEMLEQELEFFDSFGIPVSGSSTHGDKLCRELNFRNWEMFRECCDDRFGGPRTISHTNEKGIETSVDLGKHSMFSFGLDYEAYDIARDIYHTDSGGNQRTRERCRGRRDFGRTKGRGEVVGILAHPIWWTF